MAYHNPVDRQILKYYSLLILVLLLTGIENSYGNNPDKKGSNLTFGFHYGYGMNLGSSDYSYDVNFYKVQIYKTIYNGWLDYELLIQPEINRAYHQLLNIYFVQPDTPDYLEKRELYSNRRPVNEYVLSIGLVFRKQLSNWLSIYFIGSIGPMYGDADTERLARGFAFSDNISLGLSGRKGKTSVDLRFGLRHTSNADINLPNIGHNTTNVELGVSYHL